MFLSTNDILLLADPRLAQKLRGLVEKKGKSMQIIWIEDEDEKKRLAYHQEGWTEPVENDEPITAEMYADLCDQEAESENRHAFAGTHIALAKLIIHHAGPESALAIMKEIAETGGLYELTELSPYV